MPLQCAVVCIIQMYITIMLIHTKYIYYIPLWDQSLHMLLEYAADQWRLYSTLDLHVALAIWNQKCYTLSASNSGSHPDMMGSAEEFRNLVHASWRLLTLKLHNMHVVIHKPHSSSLH